MRLPGNKCSYKNCEKSQRTDPGLHMFYFPVKDEERCKQWVLNSGGDTNLLDMPPSELKNRKICETHFETSAFVNVLKQRLNRNSVPKPFENSSGSPINSSTEKSVSPWEILFPQLPENVPQTTIHDSEPLFLRHTKNPKLYKRLATIDMSNLVSSPKEICIDPAVLSPTLQSILNSDRKAPKTPNTPTVRVNYKKFFNSPKKQALIVSNGQKTKKIKALTTEVLRLRKNIKKLSTQINRNEGKNNTFLKMQLCHKSRQRWEPEMINLAMNIYYSSPSSYRNLKKHGVVLPGVSTLQSYLNNIIVLPGFSDDVFLRIAKKVQKWTQEQRLCVLMFDEIALKKNLDYNKKHDFVEGFEDLGELGRREEYASEALVFMVTGLQNRWKIPLAYFLTAKSTNSVDLKSLVEMCLKKRKQWGLIVKAVVCDQGSNNRSTICKLNIKANTPFLNIQNEKVYFFYDVPHLIKSIRNQLLAHDFVIDKELVSWKVIKDLHNLDKQSVTARSLPKLSDIHISPNCFQKMRCKLALQVFSNSTAAAIRTGLSTGQLPSSAEPTARFVKFLNDLFDCLNSSNLCANNVNRVPLSEKNIHITAILENAFKVLPTLKTVAGKMPPCFLGLMQSVRSTLLLYNDLKNNYNIDYLLTRRLNQDSLENCFSVIRNKGGFNYNPTSKSFRLSFRHLFCANLKKITASSNCEDDDSEFIFNNYDTQPLTTAPDATASCCFLENVNLTISKSSLKTATLENCSVRYTAGFILRKCLSKFKCNKCENVLKSCSVMNESTEELIKQKAYQTRTNLELGNLCPPSNLTNDVVLTTLKVFEEVYPKIKHNCNILNNLYKVAEKQVIQMFPEFLISVENEECEKHRKFIIRYALLVRLLKQTTWESRLIRKAKTRVAKLRNLTHT